MTDDDILREQLDYYNARAQEYEETAYPKLTENPCQPDTQHIIGLIEQLGTVDHVLELACGTGVWTEQLLKVAQHITAIDGAAEMLNTTRAKLGDDPRLQYQQADLFAWEPVQPYDLVFFGFFLSHVPPDKVPPFLDAVSRAVKAGGRVMIVDEHAAGQRVSGPIEGEMFQTRTLRDGSTYRIVKVYVDPHQIAQRLRERGVDTISLYEGDCFFTLIASRHL